MSDITPSARADAIGRLPDAEPKLPACGCCVGDTEVYDLTA